MVFLAVGALVVAPPDAVAQESPQQSEVVVGAQGVSVDADQDRDSKFELNREIPQGFVLDWFNFIHSADEGTGFLQVRSSNALQLDQQLDFRGGWTDKFRLGLLWNNSPHRYGDGAIFLPGMESNRFYPVADFVQGGLEDPDGNGVPFYAEPGGVDGDNDLAAALVNQLVDSQTPFSVKSRRRRGGVSFTATPTPNWTIDFDYQREWRDGARPMGAGTYQRLTDGYDYRFSVRGIELPGTIDYVTTTTTASAGWANGKFFGQGGVQFLDFTNDILATTYDNPNWKTDTLANSGIKRGLWGTGRGSMPPSNDSWNVFLTGGVKLPARTQLTATFNRGKLNQDSLFSPVTTNTALIGTADINGDGVIDSADDPTVRSTLTQPSLGGDVNTTMFGLVISSRPHRLLKLTGRIRTYDYDSTQPLFNSGFRAEYVESRIKPDFHKAPLNHVPVDFTSNTYSFDAAVGASRDIKVIFLAKWLDRGYDQYVDGRTPTYVSRTAGTRAVEGTLDRTLGVGVTFGGNRWVGGRVLYLNASREFSGNYRPGYDGELGGVRQFDIADRSGNTFRIETDFMPVVVTTVGFDFWYGKEDYKNTEYGLQEGQNRGVLFDVSTRVAEAFDLFAYYEWGDRSSDAHLRTKCSNCAPPPGATWTRPWEVPNFDWFTQYTDTTTSFGLGVVWDDEASPYVFDGKINWLRGNIEQLTRNPGIPLDLLRDTLATVALGHDFPDQENTLFSVELRLERMITDFATVGVWYMFEDFSLTDFMWDPMDPYGRNYLDIDDATRYLLLDSRYGSYTANVLQGFLRLEF